MFTTNLLIAGIPTFLAAVNIAAIAWLRRNIVVASRKSWFYGILGVVLVWLVISIFWIIAALVVGYYVGVGWTEAHVDGNSITSTGYTSVTVFALTLANLWLLPVLLVVDVAVFALVRTNQDSNWL